MWILSHSECQQIVVRTKLIHVVRFLLRLRSYGPCNFRPGTFVLAEFLVTTSVLPTLPRKRAAHCIRHWVGCQARSFSQLQGVRILELGSATGLLSIFLAKHGLDVVTSDAVDEQIQGSGTRCAAARVVELDVALCHRPLLNSKPNRRPHAGRTRMQATLHTTVQ